MSSITDFMSFLSNGQAPPSVPSYDQTSHQLPPWYNDYTQQILNKTAQYANEPYAPYTGPRNAPVNPMVDQAAQVAQSLYPTSRAYYDTAAKMLTGGPASGFGAGSAPDTGAGTPGGSGALSNYVDIAGGFPANASKYMSPYTSSVVDEMARLSKRNLTENLLPSLQDEFIRTGGNRYGLNSREGDLAVRLGRDVAADLLGQQTGALESGYKTAADIYGQDVMNTQRGAGQLADIGTASSATGVSNVGALTGLGNLYQSNQQKNLDTAYQDFLTQQQWPLIQAKNMSGALSGIQVPDATVNYRYGPASNYGASPLAQIGQLGLTYAGLQNILNGTTGSTAGNTTGGGTDWASIISSLGGGSGGGASTGGASDWAAMLDPNYNWLTGGTN